MNVAGTDDGAERGTLARLALLYPTERGIASRAAANWEKENGKRRELKSCVQKIFLQKIAARG